METPCGHAARGRPGPGGHRLARPGAGPKVTVPRQPESDFTVISDNDSESVMRPAGRATRLHPTLQPRRHVELAQRLGTRGGLGLD